MNEIWQPFSKQERALTIPADEVFEILFGGSRGPGKTDTGIVWLMGEEIDNQGSLYIHHPRYRALILRRDYNDLSDWIDRASHMYSKYGAKVVGNPAVIKWPSGAIFRCGHLKNRAYEKYLGHEYQRGLIEELTQIGDEKDFVKLLGSIRSSIAVLRPQFFGTTNPPGIGHFWVKGRYIDPSPFNIPFSGDDGRNRIYIPATIDDNPILKKIDPGYVDFLDGLKKTDPDLYRAWRFGDWDVMAGQYFKTFRRDIHTVEPFKPKSELSKYGGVDWGRTKPFSFHAAAMEKVYYIDKDGYEYKFNRMWVYQELYGTDKSPKQWAELIKKRVSLDEFEQIMGDPAMFHKTEDGSRSIATQFDENGVYMMAANNDRVGGWEVVKNWLSIAPDGLPYLIIGENCNNLIRTFPAQIHDENNPEDLDTHGEDHAVDDLRYLLSNVEWIDANAGSIKRKATTKSKYKLFVKQVDINKFSK